MSTRPPLPPQGSSSRGDTPGASGTRPASRRLWLVREESDSGDGDSFDSLTDLFLGEVARSRREFEREPGAAEAESPSLPSLPARPEPPRLRLAIEAPDGPVVADPAAEPSHPRAPATETPLLECLVVGNLPAFASAWASQYVREIARAGSCPVAYLRVQAGYVSLEVIDETGDRAAGLPGPMQDLDAALREALALTHRWIVRVDQSDESAAAARPGVRLVTLLTGIDEAARVHAYATLKELAEKLPDSAQRGPVIRVAVMGAPDPQADATIGKLIDTVRRCLSREVQHAPCSPKIRAGRPARILYNGRFDPPASLILDKLEGVLRLPRPLAPVSVIAPMAAVPPAPIADVATPTSRGPFAEPVPAGVLGGSELAEELQADVSSDEEPEPIEAVADVNSVEEPGVVAPIQSSVPEALAAPVAAASPRVNGPRVDDVALWSAAAEPKIGPAASPATLAEFIAGFTTSAIRCPYADGVELALDADGRLHLLARSESPAQDDRVIGALMVAAAWAESHAALLRPALPGIRPGAPLLHLFTSTPKVSRRLAETSLRLHLLAAVSVGDQSGWYCTELN